jgi:undecaprenyl-diphosphatase
MAGTHMHSLSTMVSQIDMAWLAALHLFTNPVLDWAAWLISSISWMGACFLVLAAVLWIKGYRLLAVQIVVAMMVAGLGAELLKHVVHRVRPADVLPQFVHLPVPNLHDSHWSFPSGHTTLAMAAAMAVVFGTHRSQSWWLVAVAILVGWARVYQGVHWPSDVLFGMILGIGAAMISVVFSLVLENYPLFQRPMPKERFANQPLTRV